MSGEYKEAGGKKGALEVENGRKDSKGRVREKAVGRSERKNRIGIGTVGCVNSSQ